jgi:hypothetical protein
VPEETIAGCLSDSPADRLFECARRDGLASLPLTQRRGLNRVTGEVAESVAEVLLAEVEITVFWHITTPGVHGVDLLFLCPDESVLALEVKGTLRLGSLPRLTPSRLRQMSREWLNGRGNPAMAQWDLRAEDPYAGVMVVDLAGAIARVCAQRGLRDICAAQRSRKAFRRWTPDDSGAARKLWLASGLEQTRKPPLELVAPETQEPRVSSSRSSTTRPREAP